MRPTIEFKPSYTLLTLELSAGEAIKAEPGAMVAQQGVEMKTGMGGGGTVRRAEEGAGRRVLLREHVHGGGRRGLGEPGSVHSGGHHVVRSASRQQPVHPVELLPGLRRERADGRRLPGIQGASSEARASSSSRAYAERGEGTVYSNSYGAIKQVRVEPGKELVVDTGHLVAFTDEVEYSIGKVGGIRSLIAGGEGLVMKFRGDGHVWIQTRNMSSLAEKLIPFLPTPRGD